MDLSDSPHTGSRPQSLRCVRCNKWFNVKPVGAIGMYCSGKCKQAAFQMKVRLTRPKPEPKQPKVSLEERVAQRVLQLLIDTNIVTPTHLPPPKPKPDQE